MKNKRIKLLVLVLAAVCLIAAFSVAVFADGGDDVTLQIKAANLSFDDSVYIVYAASVNGASPDGMKMLFWNEPQDSLDDYVIGSEDHSVTAYGKATVSGVA